jgi:hypothetical protein
MIAEVILPNDLLNFKMIRLITGAPYTKQHQVHKNRL